jgi:murein L,D-transpeptidase YafK
LRTALILAALLAPCIAGGPARALDRHSAAEEQLTRALSHLRGGRLGAALAEADGLVERHPNFHLAHLVRSDLLALRARSAGQSGNGGDAPRLEELRKEAIARVRAHTDHPPLDLEPRYLLQLGTTQKHAVVVDASRWRVFLYENVGGRFRLAADYYASLGKRGIEKAREGDQKTPVGVYHVTSAISGRRLPDLYGWGAFPINYPNEWDRLAGRTGYGIWLHGVPAETYARAPWASDGCVALANPDMEALARHLEEGVTPVVISPRVEWIKADARRAEREAFLRHLEQWRADWESLDTARYLSHYTAGFRSNTMDLGAWGAHKRRVNASKRWIRVALGDVSVIRSPGNGNLIVVQFDQEYRSSDVSQRSRKRQYWIEENGRWKIAYEAAAKRAPRLALPESFPGG